MDGTSEKLASFLIKKLNRANRQFDLISDEDKIAVAVSGGKDSLSLLRLFKYRQKYAPEKYELAAIHILGDARGRETPEHPPLVEWLESEEIEYEIVPMPVEPDEETPVPCHRCTRIRRKALVQTAMKMNCSKLAFAHHADDLAETTLLNLIYHGRLETMEPKRLYFDSIHDPPVGPRPRKRAGPFRRFLQFPAPSPTLPTGSRIPPKKSQGNIVDLAMNSSKQARNNLIRAALDAKEKRE